MSTEDKELAKKLYTILGSYEMYNYINSLGNDRAEEASHIKYEVGDKVVNQLNNKNAIVERVPENDVYIIKYDDNTKDIVLSMMIRSDTFKSKVGLGYSSSDKKKDADKIPTSYQAYKKKFEEDAPNEFGVSNSYPMLSRVEPEARLKLDSNKTSYGYSQLSREETEARLKLDTNKTSYGYSMLNREKPKADTYVEEADLEAGDKVSTSKGNGTIMEKIVDERGYVSYKVMLDNDEVFEASKSDEALNMKKIGRSDESYAGGGRKDDGGADKMYAKYLKYKIKYNLLKKEHNL